MTVKAIMETCCSPNSLLDADVCGSIISRYGKDATYAKRFLQACVPCIVPDDYNHDLNRQQSKNRELRREARSLWALKVIGAWVVENKTLVWTVRNTQRSARFTFLMIDKHKNEPQFCSDVLLALFVAELKKNHFAIELIRNSASVAPSFSNPFIEVANDRT